MARATDITETLNSLKLEDHQPALKQLSLILKEFAIKFFYFKHFSIKLKLFKNDLEKEFVLKTLIHRFLIVSR